MNKKPKEMSIMPSVRLPKRARGFLPKYARMGKVNIVAISLILVMVRPVYYARSGTTYATILLADVITPFIPVICIMKGI